MSNHAESLPLGQEPLHWKLLPVSKNVGQTSAMTWSINSRARSSLNIWPFPYGCLPPVI